MRCPSRCCWCWEVDGDAITASIWLQECCRPRLVARTQEQKQCSHHRGTWSDGARIRGTWSDAVYPTWRDLETDDPSILSWTWVSTGFSGSYKFLTIQTHKRFYGVHAKYMQGDMICAESLSLKYLSALISNNQWFISTVRCSYNSCIQRSNPIPTLPHIALSVQCIVKVL